VSRYFILISLLLMSCSSSIADVVVVENDSPIIQGGVLSENVGIETLGGLLTPILESGCKLPCKLSQIFSTAEDNQNQITITLVRGLSKLTQDGVKLGKYQITGIMPAPRGTPQIKVVFGASRGQIWLSASDVSGKSNIQITKVK
jgi:molecular chaperone DnaK (HSP70)